MSRFIVPMLIVGVIALPAAQRPKETNDTLEGRARNRRVELVQPTS